MSYAPVRAITEQELAYMRQHGQFAKLRAVIIPQSPVLACKSAETKLVNDAVTSVVVNNITSGSGVYIRNGMTAYVGSTAGASDLGMVRVKSFAENTLYFARVSGIPWTTNVFITVVDDFGLWAKLPTLDLTSVRMDDDIVYTDQNTNMSPVPIFGSDTVIPLSSGSVALDATNSYSLNDSATTISSYVWAVYKDGFPSGTITETGTGTASFSFTTAGSYDIQLTITDSNNKITTGHRRYYIYDENASDPNILDQIQVSSLVGARDGGGWSCDVTAYEGSGSAVRVGSKIIIFSDDYYPNHISIGQLSSSTRVVMNGWISDETIAYNSEESTVKFSVQGPQYWLQEMTGPSTFLEAFAEVTQDENVWTCIPNMTIDKVAHHFLYWRSTAIEVMDFYPSNNARIIGGMSASIGSIWEQITNTSQTRMLSYLCSDKYGRLFLYEDPQVLPLASRSDIPLIATFTDNDMMDDVDLQRTTVDPVSLLEVAGLAVPEYAASGSPNVMMYMSRAPGTLIYNRYGGNEQNDRLVVSSQADANALSGMLLAKRNNEYASVSFDIGQNNRMLDIAPAMYFRYAVDPSYNARNVEISSTTNWIPIRVEYNIEKDGSVSVTVEAEKETSGIPGYTVNMPQEPIVNIPEPPEPPVIPYPYIPDPYIPPIVPPIYFPWLPPGGVLCREGVEPYGPYDTVMGGEVLDTSREGLVAPFAAWARPASGPVVSGSYIGGSTVVGGSVVASWLTYNPSRYEIRATNYICIASGSVPDYGDTLNDYLRAFSPDIIQYEESNDSDWFEVVLMNANGTVVATGIPDINTVDGLYSGSFYLPAAGVNFDYIAIRPKIPAGGLPPAYASGSYLEISVGLNDYYDQKTPYCEPGTCGSYYTEFTPSEKLGDFYDKGFHFSGLFSMYTNNAYGLSNGPCFTIRWTDTSSPALGNCLYHIYGYIERWNGLLGYCPITLINASGAQYLSSAYTEYNNFDFVTTDCMQSIDTFGIKFTTDRWVHAATHPKNTHIEYSVPYNFFVDPVPLRKLEVASVLMYNVCAQV